MRLLLVSLLAFRTLVAQDETAHREVRQLVTFLLQPGKSDSLTSVYLHELLPLYKNNAAMRRVRAYRESESPVPLDLVLVSHFSGMEGMDASNRALREMQSGGRSVFGWYGVLANWTQHHTDVFVEMIPELTTGDVDVAPGLTVFEFLRAAPGKRNALLRAMHTRLTPWERSARILSETGRVIIGDGWDFLRVYAVSSLTAWHDVQARTRATAPGASDSLIAARRTIVLRRDPRFDVR